MSAKLANHPLVTRWLCGRNHYQPYRVTEIKFRETPKQLIVDDEIDEGRNKRLFNDVYGYGTHFSKTDQDFHPTREAAIAYRAGKLWDAIDSMNRKVQDLRKQVAEVIALRGGSTGENNGDSH